MCNQLKKVLVCCSKIYVLVRIEFKKKKNVNYFRWT